MKQHLDNLMVERFRGLRNLELKDLGQVNLFVGSNNSGKTSVLEAISTYCRPFDPLEWLNTSRRREAFGSNTIPIARLNVLRWLFPQSADQNPDDLFHGSVNMEGTGSFAVKSVSAEYQEIRGIPDDATLQRLQQRYSSREPDASFHGAELEVTLDTEIDPSEPDLFGLNQLEMDNGLPHISVENYIFWESAPFIDRKKTTSKYSLAVRTITPVSHRTEAAHATRFSEATLSGKSTGVLELIRLFDKDIVGLQVLDIGSGSTLYVDHKTTGITPLSAFGDGLRRAVMIAITLPRVKKGVLLIDEIETAIHISVLSDVYKWLLKSCQHNNVQLFATTHSLEAVDALIKAHPASEDNQLVAYRLGQSGMPVKRYSGELLRDVRFEGGLEIR